LPPASVVGAVHGLDEIDAPPDDADIGRFADMRRPMLDRTPFNLILHNRKAMAIADGLHGVTTEEPGAEAHLQPAELV
jgi:chromosome segregation protein